MARLLRPWQDLVREKLHEREDTLDEAVRRRVWYHLTNSYNSDGQWPPTLPEAPHIVHPFNYGYCFENLLAAELLVGGVDRQRLTTDPVATIREILGPQQELVAGQGAVAGGVGRCRRGQQRPPGSRIDRAIARREQHRGVRQQDPLRG